MNKNKKFYETSDFKKLNSQWNKKLKDSGFVDIETPLATKNSTVDKQIFAIDPQAIAYISNCERYLRSGQLTDKHDLFIFERHCQGLTQQEIFEEMQTTNLKPLARKTISDRILDILKRANIKPVEFNSKR